MTDRSDPILPQPGRDIRERPRADPSAPARTSPPAMRVEAGKAVGRDRGQSPREVRQQIFFAVGFGT